MSFLPPQFALSLDVSSMDNVIQDLDQTDTKENNECSDLDKYAWQSQDLCEEFNQNDSEMLSDSHHHESTGSYDCKRNSSKSPEKNPALKTAIDISRYQTQAVLLGASPLYYDSESDIDDIAPPRNSSLTQDRTITNTTDLHPPMSTQDSKIHSDGEDTIYSDDEDQCCNTTSSATEDPKPSEQIVKNILPSNGSFETGSVSTIYDMESLSQSQRHFVTHPQIQSQDSVSTIYEANPLPQEPVQITVNKSLENNSPLAVEPVRDISSIHQPLRELGICLNPVIDDHNKNISKSYTKKSGWIPVAKRTSSTTSTITDYFKRSQTVTDMSPNKKPRVDDIPRSCSDTEISSSTSALKSESTRLNISERNSKKEFPRPQIDLREFPSSLCSVGGDGDMSQLLI